MSRPTARASLLLLVLALLALVPSASAAGRPAPAAAARVGGALRLHFVAPLRLDGHPAAVVGQTVVVQGVLSRFASRQKVALSVFRNGTRTVSRKVGVRRGPHGLGVFSVRLTTHRSGRLRVYAVHRGTSKQRRAAAPRLQLNVFGDYVGGVGSRGPTVRLLQRGLARLGYGTPVTGYVDAYAGRELLAYRKVNNLARVQFAGRLVVHRVLSGVGAFRPRYPGQGRHVEADLSRQVLALINPGGRVYRVFPVSSGKPSTPTVLGRFQFYRQQPGTNSHGMVFSSYFTGGYAVHGYVSVPPYAASHGCLRVPVPDAYGIYRWVRLGETIDVYP